MLFMVSSSYTPGLHNVTEVRGGQLRKGGNVGGSGTFDFNNSTGRDLTFFALTGIWAKLWDAEQKKKTVDLVKNIRNPVGRARNQNVASAHAAFRRVLG